MPPIVFAGIRIVEFTTGIAAPYATMFFSDHGADVVKVEPPDGDPYRAEPGFQTLNRGKRSCVLDLRTEEGRTDALALAGRADVVVIDVPQGRARELGVDFEAVRELNPAAVYLAVPPYGERGPMVDRPASPALLAAANGTMAGQDSYSGDPVYLVLPLAAYGTAGLAATAAAAALLARERWGVGQMVEVSQLAGSLAIQVGAQVTSTVAPPRREGPSPTGATGIIPAYRLYEAADGKWFYLGCVSPDFYHKLLIAIGRPELAADPRLENGPLGHGGPSSRRYLRSCSRPRPAITGSSTSARPTCPRSRC
jgi:crotonobetainyl-CoA:carnitine CoA-transferase CaiB-like acyl-CoA transferase